MSDYGYFLSRAREAAGLVSQLEARLAQSPSDMSLRINLASAVRMAERTEGELFEVAAADQVDICRYRLVRHSGDGFALQGISKSLEKFQEAVSNVYASVSSGPKARAKLSRDAKRDSEMLFGYSYAGSLGVVLLVPSERGLFITRFDDVVKTINQVFDIQNNDELRDAVRTIGPAAIHKLYEWADTNRSSGYDLDLRWTNSNSIEAGRYIEVSQFGRLASLISVSSDVETDTTKVTGVLVGFNSMLKTFHLVVPDGDSYRGHLEDGFPVHKDWTVNRSYKAVVRSDVSTKYVTGEQTSVHHLVSLAPAGQ